MRFGRRSSAVLFLFSFVLMVCGIPRCRTEIRSTWSSKNERLNATMELVSYMIYYFIVLAVFLMNCFVDSPPRISPRRIDKNVCPRKESSFLSRLLFTWFEPLIWKGYRKSLQKEDLWNLDYSILSANIVPKFEKYWKETLEKIGKNSDLKIKIKCENKKQHDINKVKYKLNDRADEYASIVPALLRTFGITFILGTSLKVFLDVFVFVNPQILSSLIDFMGSNQPMWRGYMFAVLLFIIAIIQTILSAQYQQIMYTIGLQIRTCLISIIYKKALSVSNGARRDFTVGEMVNLMSVDAYRFVDLFSFSYLLISTPVQIILSIYFLWQILGPSVLAGLSVMMVSILVNSYVASRVKSLQFQQMHKKDDRLKLMNQILSGIKVLKLYAWEPSFEKQVLAIRNEEIKIMKKQAYLCGVGTFVWSSTTFLIYLATFAAYVLTSDKNVLNAQVAFVSLALFNILKLPLLTVPQFLSNLVQSVVATKRIDKFLNCEDLNLCSVTHENRSETLVIENGSFSWEGPKGSAILRNISLKVDSGALVAVVGPVGSGKSSLISAFLGEMYKLSGVVNTKGTVAYVPQQAWIQNTTLRDNITFGEAPRSLYYNGVLEACALKPDLEILPAGDLTEIGEKGINLSGGQKQRISLARAVYYAADIYFLDDPLSAVDSHVGKHIFEQVIGPNGLLKNKTRILVTHSVTYLSQVDLIVVLKNGCISESGTFEELLENKGDFSEFLITYLEQNSEADEEDLDKLKNILVEKNITSEKLFVRQNSLKSESGSIGSFKRQRSMNSQRVGSLRKRKNIEKPVAGQKLTEDEHAESGTITWDVYVHFARSVGISMTFIIVFLNCALQGLSVVSSMWLSKWSDDKNATTPEGTQDLGKRDYYLSIYTVMGLSKCFIEFFTDISIRIGCWNSAQVLHNLMLFNLFRLPLSFMDVTPGGRILSRFSKDIDVVDSSLPDQITGLCFCFGDVLCTLFIVSCSTPIFISVILPIAALYYFCQRFYVATSRQLKRLESVSRSPIYSHFVETLVGSQSIRAYGLAEKFIKESEEKVDLNHQSYYLNVVSNRWLSVRTESICNLVIFFASFFAVVDRDSISPGLAGLSIGYTLQIALTLSWSVYMSSEVETNIVSIERIKEYSEIPKEAAWKLPNESVPENWPSKGDINFQNFQVRYREGLQLVLKGITCSVDGGQKVGIVGRTGAGKSSLTLSLFRILESAGGKILIDGIDIATLGLHTVRSRLTIIPQDPILFAGSLKINLDPFGEYSDDSLWRSLELAHLKPYVLSLNNGLSHEITEGGENFSVGQRQLICLARALLRKTKILILDEATAAVDLETDDLIQSTIRKEFADCTVLTIAHRLNTIMDYDKIIVLDNGYVVEYDSPHVLLESKNSVFYGMAVDAGLL
ncbi:multidrug resistance-associated protein 1-like isoform X2 [Planococcus citri]